MAIMISAVAPGFVAETGDIDPAQPLYQRSLTLSGKRSWLYSPHQR